MKKHSSGNSSEIVDNFFTNFIITSKSLDPTSPRKKCLKMKPQNPMNMTGFFLVSGLEKKLRLNFRFKRKLTVDQRSHSSLTFL
jgi:hypothetical protein